MFVCVCALSLHFPSVHTAARYGAGTAELPVHSHSSSCDLAGGLESYHYHSVNVPQTLNTVVWVPLNSLWQARPLSLL